MEKNLEKLFTDELADIYDAEQQVLKALPRLIRAANAPELKEALESHRLETEGQVSRLEQIFGELGEQPKKRCKGMAGLIAEGEEMIEEDLPPEVRDAGIIGAAQKVEHYEMAAYGTARTLATLLGHDNVADLLQDTLSEEKEADQMLTAIAKTCVNVDAVSGSDGESESDEGEESEDSEQSRRTTKPRRQTRAPARARARSKRGAAR